MATRARAPIVRALVLAAGAGVRFGGDKLAAPIDGRPILQHVLDVLSRAGFDAPIVVLSPRGGPDGIEWRGAQRVTNEDPGRGLSSSLRVGWGTATAGEPPPDAVLIALGDQPLVDVAVIRKLADVRLDPALPIVAPRYSGSGAHNPLRIETGAGALVDETTGDRGLGPVLERHRDLVRWLDIEGDNLDVDTAADLAEVAARLRARP